MVNVAHDASGLLNKSRLASAAPYVRQRTVRYARSVRLRSIATGSQGPEADICLLALRSISEVLLIPRRTTFRGLPLTLLQDSEIRHYIHCQQRKGLPWDTAELGSMIEDMLSPPELVAEESSSVSDEVLKENAAATEDHVSDESKLD